MCWRIAPGFVIDDQGRSDSSSHHDILGLVYWMDTEVYLGADINEGGCRDKD